MLQQTQVSAVIPYYERFLRRFPTIEALAAPPKTRCSQLWSGLGYYARGRNLHRCARKQSRTAGSFPKNAEEIETAARDRPIDRRGDRRVRLRRARRDPRRQREARAGALLRHRRLARRKGGRSARYGSARDRLLPKTDIETYTQALMDLGATVCVRTPKCEACPVSRDCIARRKGKTSDIPAPRPRKPLPQKAVTWLLLHDRGQLLSGEASRPGNLGRAVVIPRSACEGH